jgi:protein ImuB
VAAPAQSHVPEAGEQRAVYQGALPLPVMRTETGTRPERIFERPERVDVLAEVPDGPPLRFLWRRVQRTVTRADGPERIAPEWWTHMAGQALPRARDYYRVEDREGRRYWLFREGLYEDGRGGPPDWFVHGLFA